MGSPLFLPRHVQLGVSPLHIHGCAYRPVRFLPQHNGRAEHGHDFITDILVQGAFIGKDDIGHRRKMFVEQGNQALGIHLFRDFRGTSDIAKQGRHPGFPAAERQSLGFIHNSFDQRTRQKPGKMQPFFLRFHYTVMQLHVVNGQRGLRGQ